MEKKLITVIIPTYNRKKKLLECISSILEQTYEHIEVLVVDDASTDGTEELFQRKTDPRLRYIRYETNRGACYARNCGAALAKGELLAFQDSDDLWHPKKLEKQYAWLLSNKADLCFCGMNRISEKGSRFYFPVHPFRAGHELEAFLAENRAGTQTMLMYRHVWERLQFDETIKRYQDWDFGIRADTYVMKPTEEPVTPETAELPWQKGNCWPFRTVTICGILRSWRNSMHGCFPTKPICVSAG